MQSIDTNRTNTGTLRGMSGTFKLLASQLPLVALLAALVILRTAADTANTAKRRLTLICQVRRG